MAVALDLILIFLLIVLNGLFALSEMALASSNRNRLALLEVQGVRGAARAMRLTADPQHFLPAVQIGITLIGIVSGAFGGARVAESLAPVLHGVPQLAPFAGGLALTLVVIGITYLSLINHFNNFSQGVLATNDIVYYLSFIGIGLFLTHRTLDSYRWR